MKKHITQKATKNSNYIVLGVSYCDLQNVLKYLSPIAYNAGRDGWNYDLYRINDTYSIVTGYRGFDRSCTHRVRDIKGLNQALRDLETKSYSLDLSKDESKIKLVNLLNDYI
ncbi:sequence-specific DNA binding RNA polymerase II transcription factor [Edwardsiella phage vB_EtaM_ET-ABTNL-9]|nr:sequence-specific DNA binding RNA polymerase II transcription factor [Edwardsiella phage vB_EtaM_ET-ABTNL-9]